MTLGTVSCVETSISFDEPWHDATRGYLRAVADGGSPVALYGACGGKRDENAHRVLAGEGAGFEVSLVSSTKTDDTATVNVTITGQDGSGSPYAVDLRRENGTWLVCAVGANHIAIQVD